MSARRLLWTAPASRFHDGMPIGTGRLGAMGLGRPDDVDVWVLNEESCWSGGNYSTPGVPAHPDPAGEWEAAAEALRAGDVVRAEEHVRHVQFGHSQAYQPLVTLRVAWSEASPGLARRELDTAAGVVTWSTLPGRGERSCLAVACAPREVLAFRYDLDGTVDLDVLVDSPHPDLAAVSTGDPLSLALEATMPSDVAPAHDNAADPVTRDGRGVRARVAFRLVTDGVVEVAAAPGVGWRITGARRVELFAAAATDNDGPLRPVEPAWRELPGQRVTVAAALGVDGLLAEQTAHREELVSRLVLDLPTTDAAVSELLAADRSPSSSADRTPSTPADHTPSTPGDRSPSTPGDRSPSSPRRGRVEAPLTAELGARAVELARHLMLSSSAPEGLPIPLQGLWNDEVQPPWSANYTLNINAEMNYWPALPLGLGEHIEPLVALTRAVASTGEATARDVLRAPGWAAFHNTDAWGFSRPVGDGTALPCWTVWPMAGPWLLLTLWDRFEYTLDAEWLAEAWLPLAEGAVRHALARLEPHPDGSLVTVPASSPENQYLLPDGTSAAIAVGSTMDDSLLRGLFEAWLAAHRVLDAEHETLEQVRDALPRIPWPDVAAGEPYPEWREPVADAEPEHRHVSHLVDFYPLQGALARPDADLRRAAALETLRRRGPDSTGWALAWRVCLAARLRDGEAVERYLARYFTPSGDEGLGGVYDSLLCAHPPFQIDGNFGVAAGILESLVQSRLVPGPAWPAEVEVHLLPALPPSWVEGSVRGVHCRGGLVVDVAWVDGEVAEATIHATHDVAVSVHVPGQAVRRVALRAGTSSRV